MSLTLRRTRPIIEREDGTRESGYGGSEGQVLGYVDVTAVAVDDTSASGAQPDNLRCRALADPQSQPSLASRVLPPSSRPSPPSALCLALSRHGRADMARNATSAARRAQCEGVCLCSHHRTMYVLPTSHFPPVCGRTCLSSFGPAFEADINIRAEQTADWHSKLSS